jgi:hypothetical protein
MESGTRSISALSYTLAGFENDDVEVEIKTSEFPLSKV